MTPRRDDTSVGWLLHCHACEVSWIGAISDGCWVCGGVGDSPYLPVGERAREPR